MFSKNSASSSHNSCQMAKRVQQYNRGLIDDRLEHRIVAVIYIEDLFASTGEDELVDSEDESCSSVLQNGSAEHNCSDIFFNFR